MSRGRLQAAGSGALRRAQAQLAPQQLPPSSNSPSVAARLPVYLPPPTVAARSLGRALSSAAASRPRGGTAPLRSNSSEDSLGLSGMVGLPSMAHPGRLVPPLPLRGHHSHGGQPLPRPPATASPAVVPEEGGTSGASIPSAHGRRSLGARGESSRSGGGGAHRDFSGGLAGVSLMFSRASWRGGSGARGGGGSSSNILFGRSSWHGVGSGGGIGAGGGGSSGLRINPRATAATATATAAATAPTVAAVAPAAKPASGLGSKLRALACCQATAVQSNTQQQFGGGPQEVPGLPPSTSTTPRDKP